ncbi:DUF2269 family protein [Ureibacillus terrenus]|uniref:DUF2269 family protein n=1 Tax=Ureibacillus terrenus TaxID=118246 RepID=A0A540V5R7_9BACL|nr:hypothetical protein [Ureibacillus terrenus]MED3661108.1 hypothetical protein [Ureibacillus terrenus]MED3764414.1 hypothetical protein [Ureibacillus terrenus]TQE92082.1 hypothetical protein FKZ59_02140 [Ureibacillus terrenus]
MDMLHTIFLFIHVLSAVVSIGPLVTLIPITKKMEEADEKEMAGYVNSFKLAIDVVKHAGHVLVISGAILVIITGWTWKDSWIVLTLAVMFLSIVFLAKAFKPTLQTFGTSGFQKEDFIVKLRKAAWKYIILLLIMLWLMVAKPMLW